MPQAVPKLTKLHDFIMLCQQKEIARCRKDTGMTYLKERNTVSLLQKEKMFVKAWIQLPLLPALPLCL